MRVLLVGTPADRARLHAQIDRSTLRVVAEFDSLSAANAAGLPVLFGLNDIIQQDTPEAAEWDKLASRARFFASRTDPEMVALARDDERHARVPAEYEPDEVPDRQDVQPLARGGAGPVVVARVDPVPLPHQPVGQ